MKVKDLIAELEKYDGEVEVEVPVQTYTQVWPTGYFKVNNVTPSPTSTDEKAKPRLWVYLGEGFIVSKRKQKPVYE